MREINIQATPTQHERETREFIVGVFELGDVKDLLILDAVDIQTFSNGEGWCTIQLHHMLTRDQLRELLALSDLPVDAREP